MDIVATRCRKVFPTKLIDLYFICRNQNVAVFSGLTA